MKKILKNLFFLCFSVIFITACNKQDVSINPVKTADASSELKLSNVKLENGMLVFNTKADLDSAIVLINKHKDPKWVYKQFPEHISHHVLFTSLTKGELNLLDSSTVIPDKYKNVVKFAEFDSSRILVESISIYPFSILANKDGFYGLGNKVFKIASNYIYGMTKEYYLSNSNTDFTKITSSNENVKVSSVGFNGSKLRTDNQYLGTTDIVFNGARRVGIYLWLQAYNDPYYNSTYQQVDVWGQFEDYGCNGWFCHSYWKTNYCYGMNMSGSVGVAFPDIGLVELNAGASIGPINDPNLVAQVHAQGETTGTFPGTVSQITTATIHLSCDVSYYFRQPLTLDYYY